MRYIKGTFITLFWMMASITSLMIAIDLAEPIRSPIGFIHGTWLIGGVLVFVYSFVKYAGKAAMNVVEMFYDEEYED